jgi:hypothetical protein
VIGGAGKQRPAECARALETDLDVIDLYFRHALLPALAGGGGFNRFAHSAGPV